jgi:hypothetical protein
LLVCSLVQTEFLVACQYFSKHVSQISVALFEMMLVSLYMLVLVEIGVLMLMVDMLIHFISYLSSWLLAYYLFVISLWGFTLVLQVLA